MADWNDVRAIALSLPEVVEDGLGFGVRNGAKVKGFVWAWKERVDPKKPRVPRTDVVAVRVPSRVDKEVLLDEDEEKFFTEPHYNGFPAVLVRLPHIDVQELRELVVGAWLCQAPKALAAMPAKRRPPT